MPRTCRCERWLSTRELAPAWMTAFVPTAYGSPCSQRRLERCRRDLADPRLAAQYIDTLARRWAFADGTHLSKAFKSAYGITPAQWRASTSGRH